MHAAQPIPRLSPTEAQILETFLNPEATFLAVAKSLKLDLQELIEALTSPAIRAALNALSELDTIRRRLSLAPIVPGALNALRRLLDKGENLTEVRRAATTILTTYTRLERAQPRSLFQPSRAENNAAAMDRYHAILAEGEAARTRASDVSPSRRSADADRRVAMATSPLLGGGGRASRPEGAPSSTASTTASTGPSPARADATRDPLAPTAPCGDTQSSILSPQSSLPQPTAAAIAAAAGRAISVYDLLPQPARAPPSYHDLPASPVLRAAA